MSLGEDATEGHYFRHATFGYSRGLVMCAIVLNLAAAMCIIVEHVRRRRRKLGTPDSGSTPVTSISYNKQSRPLPPPRPAFSSYRARRSIMVAPTVTAMPPDFRKASRPTLGTLIEDVGMRPCEVPGCQTCGYVIQSNVFLGPEGEPFGIRERLDCQEKGVVYAIICMRDDHVFIGHSEDRLESTFAMHMANIKAMNLSDPVAHHFTQPDHKIRDIRVTALSLIDTDLETRERLEKSLHYDMDRPHNSYFGVDNNFTFL
ncbi:hypothetical protein ElyMa_005194800 [Elysia marginata]|uniref:Uncharacterized protein n=1 Tax=Elysia marginata TaxID=1093978 RepID=A0AAV4JSX1_9GAST|nr:hypothetical protein ElyMa_005194800 [Elysia marginata]